MPQVMASTDVIEVFSLERIGEACKQFGLEQGLAMDIKSGYDFALAADRAKCWAAIEKEKPTLVIGSPPCTLFSRLQQLKKHMYADSREWMMKFQERTQQAKRYVQFFWSSFTTTSAARVGSTSTSTRGSP